MRFTRRAVSSAVLTIFFVIPSCSWAREDAARLFRDELIDAPARLGWKGAALSDETRFAAAATGLSWLPEADGAPLVRQGKKIAHYDGADSRLRTFLSLRTTGRKKEAFSYALSLLLDPPAADAGWVAANEYLASYGDDVDRALVGVLQAPEKLPLLPTYQYASMDSLTRRASPRLLPLFLSLSESSDRYLRSRAVAALGMIAYHAGPSHDTVRGVRATLRETSMSSVRERMVSDAIQRAATDKNWRVRAASALAIGLMRDQSNLPLLEKLSRDKAFVSTGTKASRAIVFPVRAQAAASLGRFDRNAPLVFRAEGKEADRAARGANDVTKDQSDVRRGQVSRVRFVEGEW